MIRTITYDLKAKGQNSNCYYSDADQLAQEWFTTAFPQIKDLIQDFSKQRIEKSLPERAPISCAYDLLVLGVLLTEHGSEADNIPGAWGHMLQRLTRVQARHPKLESLVKMIRGVAYNIHPKVRPGGKTPGKRMEALLAWLTSCGETSQAERLSEWVEFFHGRDDEGIILEGLEQLAKDFSVVSMERLGKYTENIDIFLQGEAKKHTWRYDAVFVQRTRVEYHLAMLGNALLNLVNREEFLQTKKKIVILPPCMRALSETQCKAKMTENGQQCAGCTPHCRIHQVTKLGEKHGFSVFMIPDEIRGYAREKEGEKAGLVGVSCVLTNWTGGWDADHLGIPAQGILLDYVGCSYHWDETGFPTDINFNQLLTCLNIKTVGENEFIVK